MELCEARTGNGSTVAKRFFSYGFQEGSDEYYYSHDHLGSLRELTDDTGALVARYDYDRWGRMSLLNGTALPDFGYAGYYLHAPTGLNLAVFRAYDPDLGQWLSRDPIGERGGIRLHGYVGGDPVNASDPSGLFFETGWDVGNVVLDLNSIQSNISEGNYGDAVIDLGALALEGLASVVPGVPGGAGSGLRALRKGSE